jgi:hypothetical protein
VLWQIVLDYKEERGPKTASRTNEICNLTFRPAKGTFTYAVDGIIRHEKNWRNRLKRVESNRLCTNLGDSGMWDDLEKDGKAKISMRFKVMGLKM